MMGKYFDKQVLTFLAMQSNTNTTNTTLKKWLHFYCSIQKIGQKLQLSWNRFRVLTGRPGDEVQNLETPG